MQITSLEQCFSRKKMVKIGKKNETINVTYSITMDYKNCSLLAYLRPTLPLVVFTRVLRALCKENSALMSLPCFLNML